MIYNLLPAHQKLSICDSNMIPLFLTLNLSNGGLYSNPHLQRKLGLQKKNPNYFRNQKVENVPTLPRLNREHSNLD